MDQNNYKSDEKVKCLQINLQHCKNAMNQLVKTVIDLKIDIILAQEPYFYNNIVSNIPLKWKVIQSELNPKSAIIIVNEKIQPFTITSKCTENIVWSTINFRGKFIFLCSAYMPPSVDIDIILNEIEEFLKTFKPQYFLISSDTNCKLEFLGNKYSDAESDKLLDFIFSQQMFILNNSKKATFNSPLGESHIDLTFCSDTLQKFINNWKIEDLETLSDHNYISFNITSKISIYNSEKPVKKYCSKKADWDLFEKTFVEIHELNINIDSIKNGNEIDLYVKNLTDSIHEACNRSMPLKKNFSHSIPWWNKTLDEKRKNVNKLRKIYQKCKILSERLVKKYQYYSEKKDYQNLITKSKIESWEKFCTQEQTWGMPYKLISKKLKIKTPISFLRKENNTLTKNPSETMSYLLNNLIPDDRKFNETDEQKSIRDEIYNEIETENDLPFSKAELENVLFSQNLKSAPGIDNIPAILTQKVFQIIPEEILKFFNLCLTLNYFPKQWKIASLIVLLKSKSCEREIPSSYRPISLLPNFGKILEKLISNRLTYFLYKNKLMNDKQFGFVPQKSTEDALNFLIKKARNQLNNKNFLLLISLDISGAFNNAWWPFLLNN
jgi:hypothetical protein